MRMLFLLRGNMAQLVLRPGQILAQGTPPVCIVCGAAARSWIAKRFEVRFVPRIQLGFPYVAEFPVCGLHRFHWLFWFSLAGFLLCVGLALAVGIVVAAGVRFGPLGILLGLPCGIFFF